MESKHTSGPWEAVRSLTCGHLRAAHNYQVNPKEEWTDADLKLISAAPEMLEVLVKLLDSIEAYAAERKPEAEWDEYDYMMIPRWRAAKALVEKATASP